jgi:hypothetical protein
MHDLELPRLAHRFTGKDVLNGFDATCRQQRAGMIAAGIHRQFGDAAVHQLV